MGQHPEVQSDPRATNFTLFRKFPKHTKRLVWILVLIVLSQYRSQYQYGSPFTDQMLSLHISVPTPLKCIPRLSASSIFNLLTSRTGCIMDCIISGNIALNIISNLHLQCFISIKNLLKYVTNKCNKFLSETMH